MADTQMQGDQLRVYESIVKQVLDAEVVRLTPKKLIPFLVGLRVDMFAVPKDIHPFASGLVERGVKSISDLVKAICEAGPDQFRNSLPASHIKVTVLGLNLEALCRRIRVCMFTSLIPSCVCWVKKELTNQVICAVICRSG